MVTALGSVAAFGVEPLETALELLQVWRDSTGEAWARRPGVDAVPVSAYGAEWRLRAASHLARRLDAELREVPAITSEAAARALMRGLALELEHAGEALENAARVLRGHGQATWANVVHRHGRRALEAAAPYLS